MARSSRFWDRHAVRYSKRPVADEAAYQKKLRMTQEHLHPDMEILEFGCGTGSTALTHAPYVKHILAIDYSPKMIEIARTKADAQNVTNATFEHACITDFDGTPASYDAVMGHSILHLMKNWREITDKVHAMLKPGGIFVTSTTCLKGQLPLLRAIIPIGNVLGLLPNVEFFSGEELTEHLKKTGFTIAYHWEPDDKVVFIIAQKAA